MHVFARQQTGRNQQINSKKEPKQYEKSEGKKKKKKKNHEKKSEVDRI
jgi:hypothetical protein